MIVIPALDIRNGACVRLLHGNYDAQTTYDVDPVAQAQRYAALGLTHLHLVDLDGAAAGEPRNTALLRRMVAATGARVQVGGGIRTAAHIETLLEAGVSRVVIGSMAVNAPEVVQQWFTHFGPDSIVLALDVRCDNDGTPRVSTNAWREQSHLSFDDVLDIYRVDGLQHVLCTDIDRDGAMTGPSLALYQRILARHPALQLQASGGIAGDNDLARLARAGVPAAITGKALLEGRISKAALRQC